MEVRSGRSVRRRIAGFNRPVYFDNDFTSLHHNLYADIVDVPCYDITIPEDKFEELMEEVEYYRDQSHQNEHAQTFLKQARIDERVRMDNPAVQKAWMRYLMLLEIARK